MVLRWFKVTPHSNWVYKLKFSYDSHNSYELCEGSFSNRAIQLWQSQPGEKIIIILKCSDTWPRKWCQTKRQITESIGPHTHTSGVNIPNKQTQGQTWKSVEGSRHTLWSYLFPPLPPCTFSLSVAMVSDDWTPFLHKLTDNHWRSCCAFRIRLSMSCHLSASPMFPFMIFFGLLL